MGTDNMENYSQWQKQIRSIKILIAIVLITLVWSGSGIQASAQGAGESTQNPVGINHQLQTDLPFLPTDRIILKYKSTSTAFMSPMQAGQMDRLNARTGITLNYTRSMSGNSIVLSLPERLPVDQVQEIVDQLVTLPEVEYAEPDVIMQPTLVPNDPLYSNQWNYFTPSTGNYGINAPAAWDITTGSSSIVVAVIDTGITNHAEFVGRTVPGYDFISEVLVANDGDGRDSDPSDPGDWITSAENNSGYFAGCGVRDSSWHGTHTAGTIGAASNNGIGVAGINWNSKILPVRVLGKCGGYVSDIIDGMLWAAGLTVAGVPANANPAKIENLSLGGAGSCGTTLQNAINAITAAGTTIVVSAGNSNTDASGFLPANCSGVITVAATSRNGNRAGYSNYGSTVEISAPGGDSGNGIFSTLNTGTQGPVADTYAYYQGTSMAAPHVSGVISLLYSLNPSLTPSQVLQIIQNTATNFPTGSTCNTSICGSGIVNAGAAVASMFNTLSVTKSGTGNGNVTSSPVGIDCGSTCSASFINYSTVTLTATNATNSIFTGWSGSGCSGTGTCLVTMDTARSVIATFTLKIYYVKVGGAGDCSSWANACSLQSALATASSNEIWVAAGTYKPDAGTDRSATFQLKNGVALYGGFAGTETARNQRNPEINLTILSGDIDNNDSQTPIITDLNSVTGNSTNSRHVVTGADNAILDGFIITAGYADGPDAPFHDGGGMYNDSSSPTLTSITFSGNFSEFGGGMYNGFSSPTLTNITFSGNSASEGGGMENEDSSPTLTNVTFSNNWGTGKGGGIANEHSNPTLTNVTFSNNSENVWGGGMFNSHSNPELTNVTFSGNSADYGGGGMSNYFSNPTINNTIFWGNTAPTEGQINNDLNSTSSLNDSVVQGGCPSGSTCTNIITADPLLGTLGNYGGFTQTIPLQEGSSAIDAGNDVTCAAYDQRGIIRPQGAHCDIGAFEFDGPITYTISGNAGVAGATLSYTDGTSNSATADSTGNYLFTVSYNWSGRVTLSKLGYTFSPDHKDYTNVLTDQIGQDYTATPITYTISGNAGVAGATLSYTDGTSKTATSDSSGNYTFTVSYNWFGTVTPSKAGYTFSPVNRSYTNIMTNQTSQNYTVTTYQVFLPIVIW